ncbi:hypothetical protein MMA231_02912 [Asticcacaulis sp. MM231]|uniref:YoaK family protein n=1 Tax=Asticcacaulis sp. MM231 TaxID=3157666 RepID=UPI0032D5885B
MTNPKPERTLPVAALLITAAGMLDAFTYVGYGGVFANAMTGNIVLLVVRVAKQDYAAILPFLAPILSYLSGVAVAHILKERPLFGRLRSPARTFLALEIAFLILVAFLPRSIPDMLVVTGIAFVAAMQATAFTRIGEFAYTSVTTSANLRHFATGLLDWLVFRKNRESRRQAVFFLTLCAGFIGGALAGAEATTYFGHGAVWLPAALLAAALVLCLPWNVPMRGLFNGEPMKKPNS